jgi:hypothetical protein
MKTNSPDIGIFLNRRLFNTLIHALTHFVGTEKEIGVTELSTNSAALKFKIMKYARPYKNGNADCVALYFFKKEAAVLLELLTSFFSLGRKNIPDYYNSLNKKGHGDSPTSEKYLTQ